MLVAIDKQLAGVISIADQIKPEAKAAIVGIDIVGSAASARVDSDNLSGFRFSDSFHLLKVNGAWTIVSKIYHTHPAEQ